MTIRTLWSQLGESVRLILSCALGAVSKSSAVSQVFEENSILANVFEVLSIFAFSPHILFG
jgi:hypothetical protein